MAQYPTIYQGRRSSLTPTGRLSVTATSSGTFRAVELYPVDTVSITIVHDKISPSDKDTIMQFWTDNAGQEIDLRYDGDGQLYRGLITQRPQVTWDGHEAYSVTVKFVGRAV